MLKAQLDPRGFVVIEDLELGKTPKWEEIRAGATMIDGSLRPFHELHHATNPRKVNLEPDFIGRAWRLITPNGEEYFLTDRAYATWKDRGLSSRQPAILMAPVCEVELSLPRRDSDPDRWYRRETVTRRAKVMLYSGSEQLGMVPNMTLLEHVEEAARSLAEMPTPQRALMSPSRLRLDIEIQRFELETPKVGETVGTGFFVENNFTGSASLRLGDYFMVLWCTNGASERQSGSMLSMQHRIAGLSDYKLAKFEGLDSLPDRVKDQLARACIMEMDREIVKKLTPAAKKQWAIAMTTASRAQKAVRHEMTMEDLLEETNRVIEMLTDPEHSGELYKRFGLRQLKTMTVEKNAGKLRRIVTSSLPKQVKRTGANAWAMIQSMNNQPMLTDVSKTIREFMPGVMFAMLRNYD